MTPTKKAFLAYGDRADYSLLSGGSFESGTTGWSLGGSSVVAGNATGFVGSLKDSRSLAVPASSIAVSPKFCVGIEHPTFRLFAKQRSGTWATALLKLRWIDSGGRTNETVVGALNGRDYLAWRPTPSLKLAQTLPLWAAGQSVTAQLVIDPENSGGAWQIDDIYLDPARRS